MISPASGHPHQVATLKIPTKTMKIIILQLSNANRMIRVDLNLTFSIDSNTADGMLN
jgi:hypothetical protein